MKTLHLSILMSSCIILINVVPLQNASGFLIAETPLQTYHNSDIILIGKVASLQKTSNFTETYHYDIKVEEYINNKQTNSTISVIASGSSIPSPPKFEIGDRVLLILDKEDGNYVVSANSFKTIPGCSSHEMLGFWAFPDEPFPQNTRSEFRVNKNCLGPLIEIWPSNDVFFSPLLQFKSGTSPVQVSCKQYTVLVIKSVDNLPACVKPKSADRLVTQGWIPGPINKITTDLHNVYYTDDKIDFSINFIGFVKSCDYPRITILDSNHDTIWKGNSFVQLCDPGMGLHPVYVNQTYQLSNGLGGPITINQTGDYTTQISFYDQSLDSTFTIISEPKFNSSTECEIKFKPKEFQSGIFPNGTSYTINYVPVFLMKPNSIGKLCINYWSIDKSFCKILYHNDHISRKYLPRQYDKQDNYPYHNSLKIC